MAINGIDSPSDPLGTRVSESTGNKTGESTGPAKPKAQANANDVVSITTDGARLLEIEAAIADVPDIDSERVERVKQAVDSGEYVVDADGIAQKMLEIDGARFKNP